MHNYKKLNVYNMAYELTKEIYAITKNWPDEEKFTLVTQIRRSAHSVNSNICEGVSRHGVADCIRFIYNAYASLQETENHLLLACDMGYISKEEYLRFCEKIDHLSRMIRNFISTLKEKFIS